MAGRASFQIKTLLPVTSWRLIRHRLCLHFRPSLQRFFGFVEAVVEDPAELLEGLGPKSYETKTRGEGQPLPALPRALSEVHCRARAGSH